MIRRLIAGFGLSGSIVLATIIGQIIAVPILLTFWGAELYGEWIVLTSLVASLSILNMGVQTYATNQMISCYVRGEHQQGTEVLHAALRLYVILCALALLATIFLVAWPETLAWLQINTIPTVDARIILGVQGLMAAYAILGGLLLSLFKVVGQYPRQLAYGLIERIILLGIPTIIAWAGGWPLHASLMTAALMAAVALFALLDVAQRTPFQIGLSRSSWGNSISLIGPSVGFFGVAMATTLLSTGIIVIITKTSGGLAVAIFTTTLMLTNLVRIVIHQWMNVLWPEITALAATPDRSGELMRWYRLSLKLACAFALLAAGGIVLVGPDILALWTRGKIEVDYSLNLFLAVYLLIQAPALVGVVFGLATNRQSEILHTHIVTALISLSAAWFLLPFLGVRGAAIALILGQVIGTIWILGLARRWFSDSWAGLLSDVVVSGMPSVALISLGGLGVWGMASGFSMTLVGFIAIGLVTMVAVWRTWLTEVQRNLLSNKLKEGFLFLSRRHGTNSAPI